MKQYRPLLLLGIWMLLCTGIARAQSSFVYIQGDKQTPFYVKLEGEMLPRYGKNYCIIPQLAAGPINLEILFQQNVYPAQKFVVQVPEKGHRGFLITKNAEGFSLYDLQQQFYLPAGNTVEDDHLPTAPAAQETTPVVAATAAPEETETPAPSQPEEPVRKPRRKPVAVPPPPAPAEPGAPVFINDIELTNNHTVQPAAGETPAVEKPVEESGSTAATEEKTAEATQEAPASPAEVPAAPGTVANSDCPLPLADERFQDYYKAALDKEGEEERLQYLNSLLTYCYSTQQAGILAKSLDGDAARFIFLKKAYSRITDQAHYDSLINLLSTAEYQEAFKALTHP